MSRSKEALSDDVSTPWQAIIPGTSQKVTVGAAHAESANGFGTSTTIVRLVSSTDCFVKFGKTPVATNADMFLPTGVVDYYGVTPGDKISVLQSTAGGTLYLTEGA